MRRWIGHGPSTWPNGYWLDTATVRVDSILILLFLKLVLNFGMNIKFNYWGKMIHACGRSSTREDKTFFQTCSFFFW